MSNDFRAYLDAKFALDSRSLNRDVLDDLRQALASKPRIRCLDLGSGTGATPRRLIDHFPDTSLEIIGLDIDSGLLNAGMKALVPELRKRGFETQSTDFELSARRGEQRVVIRFECASAFDWHPMQPEPEFDLITAHAFLDIVPIKPLLEKCLKLLEPGGLFYTTLNYDGQTALMPIYHDEEIEKRILEDYDLSMERRRIDGARTGGAYSGRRLVGALSETGFKIYSYGSSDWNITPVNRRYRNQDDFCLKSLLATIHAEVSRNPVFDPEKLDTWYVNRCREVDRGTLGLIIHQLDILAVKLLRKTY